MAKKPKPSNEGQKIYVWLLFTQHVDGMISLRAICAEEEYAEIRCEVLAGEIEAGWKYLYELEHNPVVRAWVEKAETDHLLCPGMFEESIYGKRISAEIWRKEPKE